MAQTIVGKGQAWEVAVNIREFYEDAAKLAKSKRVSGYGHFFDHGHAKNLNQRQKRKRARAAGRKVK